MKKPKKDDESSRTTFKAVVIESKNCSTVVTMLKSEEAEVLTKACEALFRFALKADENKLLLHSLNTIDYLIPLLEHEDKYVKRYAIMAYSVMVKNSEIRTYMRNVNSTCITSAIDLLSDEDEVVVEFACLLLCHFADDFTHRSVIRDGGAIEQLVNLAQSSQDPDVQHNSLLCLNKLVDDFESRMKVRDAGIITSLMERVNSEYPTIQMVALSSLAVLLQDAESRSQFNQLDGMEKIMGLLTKKYQDLHMVVLNAISNCLLSEDMMESFRNSGGLETLLVFMQNNFPSPQVKLYAAQAIGRAAKNERNAKVMHEQNIEACMWHMLCTNVDNDSILIALCNTMAVLAYTNICAKDTFGQIDTIPSLVALIPVENSEVSQAACLALANLTYQSLNNSLFIVRAGGLEHLVNSLIPHTCRDMVSVNAAACLINMSAEISVRYDIMKQGVIAAIGQSLASNNPMVCSKSAELLACFIDGAQAREQMVSQNVVEPLVQLLRNNSCEVRKFTCQALARCASDPQVSDILLKLGTLNLLHNINNSNERRMNSSLLAFDKLIESNLSAKYCVKGQLATKDIIGMHFYDPGKIRKGAEYIPLEVLGKLEINEKRAVVLVNYKLEDPEEKPDESTSKTSVVEEKRVSPGMEETNKPDSRAPSRSTPRRKRKTDKEKQMQEVQERLQKEKEEKKRLEQEQKEAEKREKTYVAPLDHNLSQYVNDVIKNIEPIPSYKEQVVALAQYVSSCMGGEVERERSLEFNWQIHVAELKVQYGSNVVPLGSIKRGTYFHRALLYKVLADRVGIPCSLIRGNYNLAWNEVLLSGPVGYPPSKYVIDLMHEPGLLMRTSSPQAHVYQTI